MENKLPEHIQKLIDQDAENYSRDKESEYSQRSVNAHRDGATGWAQQCQLMAEALSDLIEYQNLNRYFRPGLAYDVMCESQDKLKEANEKAAKLLATWNEGKEPNKTDHQ